MILITLATFLHHGEPIKHPPTSQASYMMVRQIDKQKGRKEKERKEGKFKKKTKFKRAQSLPTTINLTSPQSSFASYTNGEIIRQKEGGEERVEEEKAWAFSTPINLTSCSVHFIPMQW